MPEQNLYIDARLKVTTSNVPEEHLLCVKEKIKGENFWNCYPLPRGCLREFALTPRGRSESKLNALNPEMIAYLTKEELTADSVHIALCQAYAKEEREFYESQKAQR